MFQFYNVPNLLSFLRLPTAFLFLYQNPFVRLLSILIAMLTDGLDGFIARKYQSITRLGTILDPLMDRFFVFFALAIFFVEDKVDPYILMAFLSRDGAILLFGCYLFISGKLFSYPIGAIWCGKVTTFLQFIVLSALDYGYSIPAHIYLLFFLLAIFAMIELAMGIAKKEVIT